jgi:hypothetical protein
VVCHWKEPAAALQIREDAISTFSMKGLEPLLEQPLEIHVDLLHAFLIAEPEHRPPCRLSGGPRQE